MIDIHFRLLISKIRSCQAQIMENQYLFDFRTQDISDWYEVSDTVRNVGKSKATIVTQKTKQFQRAVFFALLNPQPNGACFAGMYHDLANPDLSPFSAMKIHHRSQSQWTYWKIILKTDASIDRFTTYEQKFLTMPRDFESVTLKFSDFHQYKDGHIMDETPLNVKNIKTIGIQAFGGVYDDFKQSGPGTLEIDYIQLI